MHLASVRWGVPSFSQALDESGTERSDSCGQSQKRRYRHTLFKHEPDVGTTNVRSRHWTRWLGVEPNPAAKVEDERAPNAWFVGELSEPLMFLAGIWVRDWTSAHRVEEGLITADYYAFLTWPPNAVVGPIHPLACR